MTDEIAAGYLLVHPAPRPAWTEATLLPPEIVSASPCFCPQFPGPAAIDWVREDDAKRTAALAKLGLAEERHDEARRWATEHFGTTFGWPSTFYTLSDALEARRRFFGEASPLHVIGLGLPRAHLAAFLEAATPPPPKPGFAPTGPSGVLETVQRGEALATGGVRLGYELLALDHGLLDHSWLCNGLEVHCAEALGIRPNAHGFIERLEDAERCAKDVVRDEVGAEPGLWLPWRVVEYAGRLPPGDPREPPA